MIKFKKYITENESSTELPTTSSGKKELTNLIAANLFRFATRPESDSRGLLLLVAALGILNNSEDQSDVNTARRLASAALTARKG